MTAEAVHHWPVPPPNGYTVDDLLTLPGLPPHTELIDGSLIFVSPQRRFHALVIDLLVNGLRASVPTDLRVEREMTVVIDERNGPEPDISVVSADGVTSLLQTYFNASDVVLAVEVVSPDSESRDRDTKPHKYAAAGIPHFWRVEMAEHDHRPVVHTHVLHEKTGRYVPTGAHHAQLRVKVPYEIDIDLTALDAL